MVTLLFTSIFIIGILAVAIYLWQKPSNSGTAALLPPPPPPELSRSLFSEPDTLIALPEANADENEKQRFGLLEKAQHGDKSALAEAHALGDKEFYNQLLNLLLAGADSDAGLLSLVSFVARQELPINRNLAQAALDSWKKAPDRNSTAKALHIAALTDDAQLYRSTVEAALKFRRAGTLPDVSPVELQALFDGEFWVLSQRTRSSGAGFILKRTLATARRELGNTADINQ